jgi:hypothetical protein
MPYYNHSDLIKSQDNTNYIMESIRSGLPIVDDRSFDKYVYSEEIQEVSLIHWTPLPIAIKASSLLVQNTEDKVLDIGSGVGKFCAVGALHTNAIFHGVEQRESLVLISKKLKKDFNLTNVNFIHANINQITFSNYNSFYFFNSFEENIYPDSCIDDSISLSFSKYLEYTIYVRNEFTKLPLNTRIVTYCTGYEVIPKGYIAEYLDSTFDLILWVKRI